MKMHGVTSSSQNSSCLRRNRIACRFAILIGVLLATPKTDAQELYSFERFKAANRDNDLMPFRDMLPRTLPAPFSNGKVIINKYGNHCNEYMVISPKVDTKEIRLIPFRRFPTMDSFRVVGNSFPSLSNIASFSQSLDPLTRKFFDPFSHNTLRNGSSISVMSCGGRVDGPELSKKVDLSPRPLLPDGRKAFLVHGVFNKWSSWCAFDDEEGRMKQNIPQSPFICVSIDSDEAKALDILRSIVRYSRYIRR
jgi:hypothetical protein